MKGQHHFKPILQGCSIL